MTSYLHGFEVLLCNNEIMNFTSNSTKIVRANATSKIGRESIYCLAIHKYGIYKSTDENDCQLIKVKRIHI
jgi:hypothetical protein